MFYSQNIYYNFSKFTIGIFHLLQLIQVYYWNISFIATFPSLLLKYFIYCNFSKLTVGLFYLLQLFQVYYWNISFIATFPSLLLEYFIYCNISKFNIGIFQLFTCTSQLNYVSIAIQIHNSWAPAFLVPILVFNCA